ncbi:FtsK/SpoIIIE domain-containing protein [Lapillicoccus sp.]|uniref:FtsK/SpoIIIE domain-containing protein n=1 Tax=Lapillicoccus sp. TaxID=1909287 RepID=UPI0039831E21
MHLRITVIGAVRGHRAHDVLVDAAAGSTASELATALHPVLGTVRSPTPVPTTPAVVPTTPAPVPAAPTLFVDGRRVPSDRLIGAPPLLDGALVILGAPGSHPIRLAPGVLELHVVSGPDAGHVFRLPPGEHHLGRAAEAGLRLEDPDVSRVHAMVRVESTHVTVADLHSSNGTLLDGARVVGPVAMGLTATLEAGRSRLQLRVPGGSPASTRPDGVGHLLVNRRPRVLVSGPPVTVTFPDAPDTPSRSRLPLLALVVPLVLSATLAAVLRSPTMLLLGLMSPVLMLTTWVGDRRGGTGRRRRIEAAHLQALKTADEALALAIRAERQERERRQPDLATVLGVVDGIQSRLWERRPDDEDSLVLRLGTGRLPVSIRVVGESAPEGRPEVEGLPVTLDLRTLGVVGVAGPRKRVMAIARALLAQLATWHSPHDVRIVLLVAGRDLDPDWSWVTYLPHTEVGDGSTRRGVAGQDIASQDVASQDVAQPPEGDRVAAVVASVAALVGRREEARATAARDGPRPDVVVVLDGSARLRTVPGLSTILERGPAVGVQVLALDDVQQRLPVEAGCLVTVEGRSTAMLQLPGRHAPLEVVTDEPRSTWATHLARAMAPLRDATPDSAGRSVPASVRLLDLVAAAGLDARTLAGAWAVHPRSTEVVIGVGADGPVRLDLRHDGPHALVAGTTGAGKSELLQSLIASLALGNRPDELVLVLIDYKGGSAFRDCAQLPHTVGVVTDLDAHLTERALTSLGAELRRRERLLAAAGAADLEDYQARGSAPPIPRLVLVIDEFRLLAEELPDFVHGLVRIAAVGRSLGVHLVLATQRPGGIVSADIRANVGLRIALRVRDRLDSTDVVEAPDAATIPESTPGRAYLRSGATALTLFQTARVAGTEVVQPRVVVSPLPCSQLCRAAPPAPTAAVGQASDLQQVVLTTTAAAKLHGIPPAPPPWLPPLPDLVRLESLRPGVGLPLGLRDDPLGQRQEAWGWDLRHGGHLGLAGGPRSGRTTALRTIAAAVARGFGPDEVHLYAVHAGGLSALASLPHTAAVASHADVEHVDEVLRSVLAHVRQRHDDLARAGWTSVAEQRDAAARTGEAPLAWLVLLVDGWESVVEALGAVDHGRPVQDLLRLLRDGAAAGVRVGVTGGRALLAGQLSGLLSTRLLLRVSDPMELALAGVPARAVPSHQPPGRAVDVRDHHEIQFAVLSEGGTDAAQATALQQLGREAAARSCDLDARRLPEAVHPLPRRLSWADVRNDPRRPEGRNHLILGVGAGDLAPVGFDLTAGERRILVVGPRNSGRSTALAVLVRSLTAVGRPVVVVGPTAGLVSAGLPAADGDGRAWASVGGDAVDELVALRRQHRDLAVVLDDAEALVGSPTEPVLREICRLVDEDDGVVVAATSASAMPTPPGTLLADLARSRTGLLLCPGLVEGDLLGIRITRQSPLQAGRGLLVQPGRRARSAQVAHLRGNLSDNVA